MLMWLMWQCVALAEAYSVKNVWTADSLDFYDKQEGAENGVIPYFRLIGSAKAEPYNFTTLPLSNLFINPELPTDPDFPTFRL